MCMIHRLVYGIDIYEQACASCHDEGVEGAPAIGDRYAWSQRYLSGNAAGLIRSTKT